MAGLFSSWIGGDVGLGVKFLDNKFEDLFAVVFGIGDDGAGIDDMGGDGCAKKGDGLGSFADVGGEGCFAEGEFRIGVGDGVVAISPEIGDLLGACGGIVDLDAESGVGISFRGLGFVKAWSPDTGFEIVLPDRHGDGAGIDEEDTAVDGPPLDERCAEAVMNALKETIGCVMEERAEAFDRGGAGERIEPQGAKNGRIVCEFECQIEQSGDAS